MSILGEFLEAVGEQPLGVPSPDSIESYRLFITASPWIPMTVIRMERGDNPRWDEADDWDPSFRFRYHLVIHQGGNGSESPRTKTREISPNHWKTFSILLKAVNFWDLPERGGTCGGMDIPHFEMEGFREGQFHSVSRWSPGHEKDKENFTLLSTYLWDLGELIQFRERQDQPRRVAKKPFFQ